MSYLHDHVDMVTAMRRYEGNATLPGTHSTPPPPPADPGNRRCPGIVLMLDRH